jgi:hypothetical protein
MMPFFFWRSSVVPNCSCFFKYHGYTPSPHTAMDGTAEGWSGMPGGIFCLKRRTAAADGRGHLCN